MDRKIKQMLKNFRKNFSFKHLISKSSGRLLIFLPLLIFISHYNGKNVSKWIYLVIFVALLWNILELSLSKHKEESRKKEG